MAKFSISEIMARKNKLRIWTVLACLCLIFLSFFFITQNPRKSMADLNISCPTSSDNIMINTSGTMTDNIFEYRINGRQESCDVNNKNVQVYDHVIVMRGVQTLKSLSLHSGAVVTHDALVPWADFNVDTFALTLAGEKKKVDIVTTGDITLTSGGTINVDGKGYPGGNIVDSNDKNVLYRNRYLITSDGKEDLPSGSHSDGYGPGYGHGGVWYWTAKAGGGGFAGVGGANGNYDGKGFSGGAVSFNGYNSLNTPLQYGSGGGAAKSYRENTTGYVIAPGGAGGGVISLRANTLAIDGGFISSNGQDSELVEYTGSVDKGAWGGAGSGGMILIGVARYDFLDGISAGATVNGGISKAENGKIYSDVSLPSFFTANGGNCDDAGGSGGGGGVIIVKNPSVNTVTIKKTLEAVSRTGADPINNFNPYALQVADQIRVRILVTNIVGTLPSLTDEVLKTVVAPIKKCVPAPATYTVLEGTAVGSSSNDIVTFRDITRNENGTAEMVYECKVQ